MMKKIYIVFGVTLLVLLAVGCSGNNDESPADNSENPQVTETAQVAQSAPVKAEPVMIASWEGTATKNTETFTVPSDEWKITWDTTSGNLSPLNFQIYVYNADGSLVGVAANVVGANSDSSVMRGAGDYYLMINSAQPYKITIETV